MTLKIRRIILILCVFAFVITAAAISFYSLGYTLDDELRLSQKGGLYASAPLSDSQIFVDNKKEKTTGILNTGLFLANLKLGEHSVLIAKEGFWPWLKNLQIRAGYVAETRAFMLPKDPKGEFLLKSKFLNLWSCPKHNLLILKEQKGDDFHLLFYLPHEDNFLIEESQFSTNLLTFHGEISNLTCEQNSLIFKSSNGFIEAVFNFGNRSISASYANPPAKEISDFERLTTKKDVKIWWDPKTNQIFADWLKEESSIPYYICDPLSGETDKVICQLPLEIFKSQFPIKNIEFFPRRKDIIIMATGNGIYAIEIDGRGGRLLQPAYKGKKPTFAILSDEENIYVLDDGSLMKIYLK